MNNIKQTSISTQMKFPLMKQKLEVSASLASQVSWWEAAQLSFHLILAFNLSL